MLFLIQESDLRMKYLRQKLNNKGYEAREFTAVPKEPAILIISPGKKPDQLIEIMKELAPGSVLVGAQSSDALKEQASLCGVQYLNLMEDEAFAVQNAIPTAEGALSIILSNTECVLRGMDIAIVGFGRIGRVLSQMLYLLGANVHVIARNPIDRAWATGFSTCDLKAMPEELKICKVLVNTVPAQIIGKNALQALPEKSLLIELASTPYGFDGDTARELGHMVILAQALPAKVAPDSASDYMAEAVLRLIAQHT